MSAPDSGWTLTDKTGISQVLVIMRSKGMCDGFIPNVTVSVWREKGEEDDGCTDDHCIYQHPPDPELLYVNSPCTGFWYHHLLSDQ
jgi:hypothetical protein